MRSHSKRVYMTDDKGKSIIKTLKGSDFGRDILDDDETKESYQTEIRYITMLTAKIINIINYPKNFILEKTSDKIRKSTKSFKKIARAHQRPTYTVLTPDKIRQIMGLSQPGAGIAGGRKKRPHDRRQHDAFLSNDKYRFDIKGRLIEPKVIPYGSRVGQLYFKKIRIPAIWVGASEVKKGNKIYRVILDK